MTIFGWMNKNAVLRNILQFVENAHARARKHTLVNRRFVYWLGLLLINGEHLINRAQCKL